VNTLKRIGIARGWILLPCVAMTFATGCAAGVSSGSDATYPATAEDDAVVSVDTAPPNIESYPHYYYDGGYAYYVEGRWYRQGPRGWGYYRQEPPQLAHARPNVARQAPAVGIRAESGRGERAAPVVQREQRERAAPVVQRERAPVAASRPRGVAEAQPASKAPPRRAPASAHPAAAPEHER
jgi:hypothetical protein